MLYRTHHHPFLFPLNPFTPSSLSSHHPQPHPCIPSSSSSPPQVAQVGMECVEGALKSSVRTDVAAAVMKVNNPNSAFSDDLLGVSNGQGAVLESDFFIDDLLDFSNAALTEEPEEHNKQEMSDKNGFATASAKSNVTLSPKDEFGSLPVSGLTVPADDLESLEWLSHFVEDSFSQYTLTCPVSKLPPEASKARCEPEIVMVEMKPSIPTPVQTKARTKRARTGGRVWSLGSPSLSESSSSSTSSSSTTTSSSPSPWFVNLSSQTQTAESLLGKPPVKKPKKSRPSRILLPVVEAMVGLSSRGGAAIAGFRRLHSGGQDPSVQKRSVTHAESVFKSGRLLPEYRPACSPTFSSELHSNNHRKVLEMRRKKEVETELVPPPVQSFLKD